MSSVFCFLFSTDHVWFSGTLARTWLWSLEWRNGNKIWIYHAKDFCRSSLLALRTSQHLFPFSLPTAGFPRGMADLLGTLFHFLPSLTPPPPPSYLPPPQTLPLILSPVPYFSFNRPRWWYYSIAHGLFLFHFSRHSHARALPTLKVQPGHQLSTRAKAFQPQLQANGGPSWSTVGLKQPLLFENESVSCFKVLILELKHTHGAGRCPFMHYRHFLKSVHLSGWRHFQTPGHRKLSSAASRNPLSFGRTTKPPNVWEILTFFSYFSLQ